MLTRRNFMLSSHSSIIALGGISLGLTSCVSRADAEKYKQATDNTWRHGDHLNTDHLSIQKELVRYATLAPSSHNTQCWKFKIEEMAILLLPDFTRRCPAVDPDDHHLYISLGCATENLIQASLANGFKVHIDSSLNSENAIRLFMESTKPFSSAQFLAIPSRQCNRTEYDGKSLSTTELSLLERAGTGNGVQCQLITESTAKEHILDFVVQANSAQMADEKFVAELKSWIRFNGDEAIRKGDGLYSVTSGNPNIPTWLGEMIFNLVFTAKSENEKYAKLVRSAAGIAIFSSEANDQAHWLEVGRCYQRFALQATSMGIRNSMLNQPVEVKSIRPLFAQHLGIGNRRPDLVVRFGRGTDSPRSLRRPVASVLM